MQSHVPNGTIPDLGRHSHSLRSFQQPDFVNNDVHYQWQYITIEKIEGQSDCDNTTPGKYGFKFKSDEMLVKLISDVHNDRSSALDTTNWTKLKGHQK